LFLPSTDPVVYVGVDEAGKGPVLGPMVAAAVRADPESLPTDVDDSKRVAPDRRTAIAAELRTSEAIDVAVAIVETAAIDAPDTDMNTLTVRGQARAVRAVVRSGDRVVADAGDTSEARFARRLREVVTDPNGGGDGEGIASDDLDVDAAHGADESDPVVGAASVVAKVARDARMAAIDAAYPAYDGIGSGYPSDPTTRRFLREYVADHGDVPPHARRSWSTCADALAAAEQSGLDEF
jgi:ribonuclease HII